MVRATALGGDRGARPVRPRPSFLLGLRAAATPGLAGASPPPARGPPPSSAPRRHCLGLRRLTRLRAAPTPAPPGGQCCLPGRSTQISLHVTGAFFLNANDAWAETQHEWPAQPGCHDDVADDRWRGYLAPGDSRSRAHHSTARRALTSSPLRMPSMASASGWPGSSTSAFEQERQGFFVGHVRRRPALGARWPGTGLPWEGSRLLGHVSQGLRRGRPIQRDGRVGKRGAPSRKLVARWGQPGLWRSADGGPTAGHLFTAGTAGRGASQLKPGTTQGLVKAGPSARPAVLRRWPRAWAAVSDPSR